MSSHYTFPVFPWNQEGWGDITVNRSQAIIDHVIIFVRVLYGIYFSEISTCGHMLNHHLILKSVVVLPNVLESRQQFPWYTVLFTTRVIWKLDIFMVLFAIKTRFTLQGCVIPSSVFVPDNLLIYGSWRHLIRIDRIHGSKSLAATLIYRLIGKSLSNGLHLSGFCESVWG